MPPLPKQLTFTSWQRSKLFDLAEEQGARMSSKLPLTLRDTHTGQQASGDASFTLMAATDIARLKPGAIKHMAPAPFAREAETTKFVHVDFWEKDLPWRYTPRRNDPHLRPWLVLLVGTDEEIQVEGGIAIIKNSVLREYNLAQSFLWAHTQNDGNTTISRILSPRTLAAQSEYVAVLVPAFNGDGNPMWKANDGVGSDKGVFPAFHSWHFWTAEAGDFETLAAALHLSKTGDVGKARLHYRRVIPADNVNIDATLEVRGAITSLQAEVSPVDVVDVVRNDLDVLNDEVENAIGLPHYGRPWLPNPDSIPDGWPADLNDDPRFRGIAGLGTWMGIEAQEALVAAAVQQAGALREAGQRISHLALGIWASGQLWKHRLPTDKHERLRILGPIMGRMVAADGGLVLDRVTSGSSPLAPALFSSAAQRILRDRSTQTRHIAGANGGINRSEALMAANQPERQPERVPDGLPHFDAIAKEMGLPPLEDVFKLDVAWIDEVLEQLLELVRAFSDKYRRLRDDLRQSGREQDIPNLRREVADSLSRELADQLQHRLPEREMSCEGWGILRTISQEFPDGLLECFMRVLEDDSTQQHLYDALWRALYRCMATRPCQEQIGHVDLPNRETFCAELLGILLPKPRPELKPIDLGHLSDILYAALDPRQSDAPARVRLCSRIQGIDCTRLIPPEFPIGLDFPTWDLLKQYDKEWLLPGASALEKDSITALQTNPAFIDAYMMGINTQFLSEMRWRDLAVERTCTPLRMFWRQVNYATQKRQADIEPLSEWAKVPSDPIGASTHQTIKPDDEANTTGSCLVVAFRSDLFRRYPATLVYLVKPKAGEDVDVLLQQTPMLEHKEDERKDRIYFGPIFVGTITPELTFFAFDVAPSELDQYWLVLDEPPAELRFRNDIPRNVANSATFAKSTLDQPTRVAISGKELKRQGDNP